MSCIKSHTTTHRMTHHSPSTAVCSLYTTSQHRQQAAGDTIRVQKLQKLKSLHLGVLCVWRCARTV